MAAPIVSPSFDDPTDSLAEWFRSNGRTTAIAATVIVLLGGGAWLYRYASAQQAVQADEQLMQPERSLSAGNIPLAQTDLKRLIQRFGGTPAATQASMLLAQTYFDQGKNADGIAVLDKVSRRGASAPFAAAVEALTAVGESNAGKYGDAAKQYLKAAAASPYAAEQSQYKANAARAFAYAGDTTQAVALWTELAKDEKSPQAAEAHLRLGELTARAASKR